MTLDQAVSMLAIVTLIEMMVATGLGVTWGEIVAVARDWWVPGRALLANYVVVPAVAVGLLWAFRAPPFVAAGFLVAAVCPGAPYGPPLTAVARGHVGLAVGLMAALAASSAVLAPLLLQALLPLVAGNEPLRIDGAKILSTLALSQFLPLAAGLYLRQRHPALAARLRKPAGKLSTVLNLLLVGLVLVAQFRVLLGIRPLAYAGMGALLGASIATGWLTGGRHADRRRAMTMATAVRNVGVGLVIVTASFPGTAAVGATTVYALFQTLLMALLAVAWGRWVPVGGGAAAERACAASRAEAR